MNTIFLCSVTNCCKATHAAGLALHEHPAVGRTGSGLTNQSVKDCADFCCILGSEEKHHTFRPTQGICASPLRDPTPGCPVQRRAFLRGECSPRQLCREAAGFGGLARGSDTRESLYRENIAVTTGEGRPLIRSGSWEPQSSHGKE